MNTRRGGVPMADFNVRADAVDVEQIMRQIRGRIRDKRGVDYTEEQIQELAKVKLEKFLDPRGVQIGPAGAVPADAVGRAAHLRVRRQHAVPVRQGQWCASSGSCCTPS